jgi:hypothetical protein
MLTLKQSHKFLLWAAHLLSAFLLPAVFVFLIYRQGGSNLSLYVFWTWEWLTRLLLVWVPVLLVWRLWQRRWGQALMLLLLVGFDVLVMVGYYFAFFASSMTENPT